MLILVSDPRLVDPFLRSRLFTFTGLNDAAWELVRPSLRELLAEDAWLPPPLESLPSRTIVLFNRLSNFSFFWTCCICEARLLLGGPLIIDFDTVLPFLLLGTAGGNDRSTLDGGMLW